MSELESKKLSNEELEEVSGGTIRETKDLKYALKDSGTVHEDVHLTDEKLVTILKNNHIKAKLNTNGGNTYYDLKNDCPITQKALIKRIYEGKIMW